MIRTTYKLCASNTKDFASKNTNGDGIQKSVMQAYFAWPGATYQEIGYRLKLQPELCEQIIENYKRKKAEQTRILLGRVVNNGER